MNIKMNTSLLTFVVLSLFNIYLIIINFSASASLIGILLLLVISSIFEFKKYHNKNLYFTFTAAILIFMWLLTYIQIQLMPRDFIIDLIFSGLSTAIISGIAYDFANRWEFRLFSRDMPIQNS